MYSPVLKKWHLLAIGVAVATLLDCFGNEFDKFIVGLRDLTSDAAQVLKVAGKLEKRQFFFLVKIHEARRNQGNSSNKSN
jgi:hypothetical protein